ncbi:hypothetical protein WJX84_005557 [Apatococcus fuscideae]|uniref:Uncharacterized protein n=1 Tax=Apatococcus fuscideae TaxID=2026836 RepID=A0AAW1TCT8_9CHLO
MKHFKAELLPFKTLVETVQAAVATHRNTVPAEFLVSITSQQLSTSGSAALARASPPPSCKLRSCEAKSSICAPSCKLLCSLYSCRRHLACATLWSCFNDSFRMSA